MSFARLLSAPKKLAALLGSIHYLRLSRELHTLLICEGLGRVLRAIARGRGQDRPITAAIVGANASILQQSEAMADCGFEVTFFAGNPDDRMHPSQMIDVLDPKGFDCVLLVENDDLRHEHFENMLRARGARVIRLRRLIDAHFATMKEMKAGGVKTCLNPYKQAVMAAVIELAHSNDPVVECGVYMGGTTIQIAKMQMHLCINRKIFALDTFEGMPEATANDLGEGFVYSSGMFTDNRRDLVEKFYRQAGGNQIQAIAGLCQDTLPIAIPDGMVSFALLDTDQYAGTKGGLDAIGPTLGPDSIIVVDDTTVHGVNKAIEEALAQFPQLVRCPVLMNFDLIVRR